MRRLLGLLLMLAVCAGGTAASAQMSIAMNALDLVDAKVDYQADYALTSGSQHFHGKVIHAPGRERWEFTTGSGPQVLLLRRDIDEAAMLWPERRWYMSTSFTMMSTLLGGLGTDLLHAREAGIEKLDGETVIRYHVDKGDFVGDLWRSADGILIKAVGVVTYQGKATPGELVLSNLRRVKVDPSVFVRPQDYFGIPLKLNGGK
jgi:hypothetical protein